MRVLAAHTQPDAPVHYRDWFELMTSQGLMPGGKDPLATFLTQVGRSPVVKRSTASGMYVLDPAFPARARENLERLAAELAAAESPSSDATVDGIAAERERRAQLTTELRDTERQLDEAIRSLGDTAG